MAKKATTKQESLFNVPVIKEGQKVKEKKIVNIMLKLCLKEQCMLPKDTSKNGKLLEVLK